MLLGYNTNGFGFHTLEDALEIIAELGYQCVAITLDVHHANPFKMTPSHVKDLRLLLKSLELQCVIETGARFLLDSRHKHRPTLLDRDAHLRREFLSNSMKIAAELGAHCVSYWSGARPSEPSSDDELFRVLADHIVELDEESKAIGVPLAIEPEPGFLIESLADYDRLCSITGLELRLTIDVGHVVCVESMPPAEALRRYANRLTNVQLDDMVPKVHRHLNFGEGQVDFESLFDALKEIGYKGPACVELSEGSRNAVQIAEQSIAFLKRFQ